MGFRIGVVDHCMNCGSDISLETFPHFCKYCIDFLRMHGCLPSGLLEQMHLMESQDDGLDEEPVVLPSLGDH